MEKSEGVIQKIGVISDTHGHLSDPVIAFLHSVDMILHAGDIDTPEVLETLNRLGRTIAVRGNMDWGAWTHALNPTELIEVGEHSIYMLHDIDRLDLDPASAELDLLISGHTHQASHRQRNGVTYLNPGSASYPRSGGRATVGLIESAPTAMTAAIVQI